jgi:hypothetical protein
LGTGTDYAQKEGKCYQSGQTIIIDHVY